MTDKVLLIRTNKYLDNFKFFIRKYQLDSKFIGQLVEYLCFIEQLVYGSKLWWVVLLKIIQSGTRILIFCIVVWKEECLSFLPSESH